MATKAKRKARAKLGEETPEQRFSRLANTRVSAAIKRFRLVGNLAGASYKSTAEQRTKIMEALASEIDILHTKFSEKVDNKMPAFTL